MFFCLKCRLSKIFRDGLFFFCDDNFYVIRIGITVRPLSAHCLEGGQQIFQSEV